MLSRCIIKNGESCEIAWGFFTAMAGNEAGKKNQGSSKHFYALSYWTRWVFQGGKMSLISRFEWIISARAGCCKRKLLRLLSKKTLHSGTELISEFPKEWVIITKILFCRVSYCFCLFGEFAKVFERQVWCVRVAHLHSAARALSSPSGCFQLSTNLDKDLFGCLLGQFSPASKGY